VSGVVRAGIDATRLGMVVAQITGSSFDTDSGHFVSGMAGVIKFGGKGMKIDISVRTISGAEAAAYAPVFDDDLEGIAAADGTNGASDHAERIAALATGSGDKILIEA